MQTYKVKFRIWTSDLEVQKFRKQKIVQKWLNNADEADEVDAAVESDGKFESRNQKSVLRQNTYSIGPIV